ncbi:MAG: flagellar motor protein MotD [Halioglobus sp.]|nr:flagellar motor protein MotD [Halioglobus sp.]
MSRKRRVELQTNNERWMVSYADFVTLLFAFFVVMYSISSVNQDKYRVLSDAMLTAFKQPMIGQKVDSVAQWSEYPLPGHESIDSIASSAGEAGIPLRAEYVDDSVEPEPEKEADNFSAQVLDAAEEEVHAIADTVEDQLQPSIDEEMIDVKRNKFWLEVEIKSSLLFESGSSELIPQSVPILVELSDLFRDMPNRIHIEGFTDNKPINTPVFPSNWELSSARAAAVVRLFERNGIEPERLAAIGYGEYKPVTGNETEEGRARNRRVVVVVLASLVGKKDQRIHEFELLKENSLARVSP